MIDLIEFWVDTHPFFTCLFLGAVIGAMSAIDSLPGVNRK
jgi:hypothetical protein